MEKFNEAALRTRRRFSCRDGIALQKITWRTLIQLGSDNDKSQVILIDEASPGLGLVYESNGKIELASSRTGQTKYHITPSRWEGAAKNERRMRS